MSERTRHLTRRTCLAVPGSSDKMLAKAPGVGADMVFLDLEDAVAPLEKDAARDRVVRAIDDLDWGDTVLSVRVNAWDTQWTYRDVVALVEQSSARLDSVMLPKTQSASEVVALDLLLTQIERATGRAQRLGIDVQIETARGLVAVDEICAASPRLESISFGPADFAASTEMPVLTGGVPVEGYPGDQFHYVFVRMLMAARANGVQVLDGPYLKIRDLDGLAEYARRTYALGFDGKWVLHPDQVPVVNGVFSPTQEQFDRAVDILDAYARATEGERRGAVMYGDEMIDEASRKMALKLVSRGERARMTRTPGER
jgi:citrate lyase subunit beta/citryl-CoA lyase